MRFASCKARCTVESYGVYNLAMTLSIIPEVN